MFAQQESDKISYLTPCKFAPFNFYIQIGWNTDTVFRQPCNINKTNTKGGGSKNKPILPPSINPWKHSQSASACCRLASDFLGDPTQAVVQALTGDGARGLDVPVMVLYAVEGEGIGDLGGGHGVLEVLLVREHENHCTLQICVLEQPEELVLDDVDPSAVGAVNYYDDSMSSSVVCCP